MNATHTASHNAGTLHRQEMDQNRRISREQAIHRLAEKIKAAAVTDEWLRHLHGAYSHRFQSDNDKIWTTGAILIPLALAPFVGVAALGDVTRIHIVVLAVTSLTLVAIWLLIAQRFRIFGDSSLLWTAAVESAIGLEGAHEAVRDFEPDIPTWRSVYRLRWMLAGIVFIGWVLIFILWPVT